MAAMRRIEKPSPTESPLLFELDPEPLQETLTALGGIPLVVQAFRSLGVPGSVQQHVNVKERERGYDEATFVRHSLVLANNSIGARKQSTMHVTCSLFGYFNNLPPAIGGRFHV